MCGKLLVTNKLTALVTHHSVFAFFILFKWITGREFLLFTFWDEPLSSEFHSQLCCQNLALSLSSSDWESPPEPLASSGLLGVILVIFCCCSLVLLGGDCCLLLMCCTVVTARRRTCLRLRRAFTVTLRLMGCVDRGLSGCCDVCCVSWCDKGSGDG